MTSGESFDLILAIFIKAVFTLAIVCFVGYQVVQSIKGTAKNLAEAVVPTVDAGMDFCTTCFYCLDFDGYGITKAQKAVTNFLRWDD